MTATQDRQEKPGESAALSLSFAFAPETLAQGIRVKPAQFSRMCGVSRQTVSQWVKRGLVALYPDGTLDPAAAAKRVIQHTDPARLRARIFKDVTKSIDDWRREAKEAKEALAAARAQIEYLNGLIGEYELTEQLFMDALVDSLAEILDAPPAGLRSLLEDMFDNSCIRAGQQLGSLKAPKQIEICQQAAKVT